MTAASSLNFTPAPPRLSKSRFCSGLQCHKKLWLEVREPDALELQPDAARRFRLEQGLAVGARARSLFPRGILVALPHASRAEKIAATARAIADRAPAVFEASFQAEGVYCTVDILERTTRAGGGGGSHVLIEVKSAPALKDEHIPDVAVQVWVARACGLAVERVELMHLNPECRFPGLSDLFVREDVTARVEAFLPRVPALVTAQLAMLGGKEPVVPIGPQCREPRDCPFEGRCWQDVPADHVTTLHGIRRVKAWELVRDWRERVGDLPIDAPLTVSQERQRRALREGRMIVEPGLGEALRALVAPVAYLDFEVIGPAIPVWSGLGPWQSAPVQFSCHLERPDGTLTHSQWIAVGSDDPRPDLARALLDACRDAGSITMYTGFERAMIRQLAAAAPDLATELAALDSRLVDLKAILSTHLYHPDFRGSFNLKQVLPVLVALPELRYDLLPINDGAQASAELYHLLFESASMLPVERYQLETELLAYCELDTLAMVKLTERLRALAS